MRKLIAISLLLLFCAPAVMPLFGESAEEAALPACCRGNGKHKCMLADAPRSSSGNGFSAPATVKEKCPYAPMIAATLHADGFLPAASAAAFAGVVQHPAVHAQTEARYRISFARSRQKRGPPASSLLS